MHIRDAGIRHAGRRCGGAHRRHCALSHRPGWVRPIACTTATPTAARTTVAPSLTGRVESGTGLAADGRGRCSKDIKMDGGKKTAPDADAIIDAGTSNGWPAPDHAAAARMKAR